MQVKALLFDKTSTTIPIEYSNYNNVFSLENIVKHPEYFRINNYVIEIKKSKQLFFRSIYSLKPVKLEILKTYIKTNLANSSI